MSAKNRMSSTVFHAMGSKIIVRMDGKSPKVQAALEKARDWFLTWEACLSRFQPDSELSLLNQRAGQATKASQTLWDVIQAAAEAIQETNGLVTPTILKDLEAAGYNKSFTELDTNSREQKQVPLKSKVTSLESDSEPKIQFLMATRTIIIPEGISLDLGGFAKGWAADITAHRLGNIAPTLVNAGGDIAVSGTDASGQAWQVGIGHPDDPKRHLAIWPITGGGIATSGRNSRQWTKDGIQQHHLIDPRSGQPAQSNVVSTSVLASSALKAEIAAKLVCILGSKAGMKWLVTHHLTGIIMQNDGQILNSTN